MVTTCAHRVTGLTQTDFTQRAGQLFLFILKSGDESFSTCLKQAWHVMMLCSLMRIVEFVTLQPVLSGRAFFGACVCAVV